ncbi:aromatic-ring-hydroxylating dioxygenase subunit beta [Geodermatophilus sp. SYSU D01186]
MTAVDAHGAHVLERLLQRARVEEAYRVEGIALDEHRMTDWLAWLHPDFRYEVPIPITRDDPGQPQYSSEGLLAVEVRASIELWAQRLSGDLLDLAYAENPPVRTRHFVTDVVVEPGEEGVLRAAANVLLAWSRRSDPPTFATGRRLDELVERPGGGLLLRHRRVLLDSEVVHLNHLRVIF